MPLFSVIIPTYNRLEYLKEALISVWTQRFSDFELIVVDDGSTDNTAAFVSSLGSRARVHTHTNLGPATARNHGARLACGEYIAFLDSDDLWLPWTLACFARLIEKHSRPSVLGAKLVEFTTKEDLAVVREMTMRSDSFPDYYSSHASGYYVGAGMLVVRRDEFLRVGGFSEQQMNCEDHDLMMRLGESIGFVQILDPITLGWRRHSGSVTLNTKRNLDGVRFMLRQELGGMYPGGIERQNERRRILTSHFRSVTLRCLHHGMRAEAWAIYQASFQWHVALGRWKYLIGFPLKALFC